MKLHARQAVEAKETREVRRAEEQRREQEKRLEAASTQVRVPTCQYTCESVHVWCVCVVVVGGAGYVPQTVPRV